MPQTIRDMLTRQVEMLHQGRYSDMLPLFELPLAVEIGGKMTVLSSPEQFIEAMGLYRNGLLATGVTGISLRMTALELQRYGRFRVWADIDHLRTGSRDQSADQLIIYCRQDGDVFTVELLHCRRLALTMEAPQRRARLA